MEKRLFSSGSINSAGTLQAAQIASFFGTGLYSLSAIWKVMEATPAASAPLALGGLLLAGTLPGLLLAVPIGRLVDHLPRHRLAAGCDLIRAALLLLVFSAGPTSTADYLIVAALLAALDEVHEPSLSALLRDHTPVSLYRAALSRMQVSVQLGWLTGALSGGALLWLGEQESWTASWPFAVNAASFAVSAALIARAGPAPRHTEQNAETEAPVKVTVRALLRRPAVLLAAVQLAGLAAILQLSNLILPAYVRYALHQDVPAYGLLEGLYALGALTGAALSRVTGQRTLAALLALSLALIALAPHLEAAALPVSAASFFALGLALSTRLSIWAQLQTNVPSEFQGRVHALINGLISATILSAVMLSTVSVTLRSAAALYTVLAILALLLGLTARLKPQPEQRTAEQR